VSVCGYPKSKRSPSESVLEPLNGAYPSIARPEFYRRNERKSEPLMVIPRQGSELKAVEEACREASRTVGPLNGWNDLNGLQH
jgi:hypothetical protein